MSVLIKGMEIPTRCLDCPMNCRIPWDSTFVYPTYSTNENCPSMCFSTPILCRLDFKPRDPLIRNECPLVEVPQHRRLIDADALLEEIIPVSEVDSMAAYTLKTTKELMINHIINAPTVIESEE